MPIRNHARMIQHLVTSYAEWWEIPVRFEDGGGYWTLKGPQVSLNFPVQPEMLVPTQIEMVQVPLDHSSYALPFPQSAELWESMSLTGSTEYPCDILTFLAGQLWRAEELLPAHAENASNGVSKGFLGDRFHFFDLPIVDLWMRHFCERALGNSLLPSFQKNPRFWMTYDIDCLQKWKLPGVLKHLVSLPVFLSQGQFSLWFRTAKEAILSHFPERDPWFTVPQILAATRTLSASFFWLGHPKDQNGCRYDIRRKEYSRLVKRCLQEKHQVGLHGSPLHFDNAIALAEEKSRVEGIAGVMVKLHRQHYLRIAPLKTFRHLESLGIALDSTLGFSDRVGFRCGSCIPMRWWDFEQGSALHLLELPFAAGDWTIHDPSHFEPNESRHRVWNLADQVRLAGGILVLDFHEMYFSKDFPDHATFHQSVLEGLWMREWRDWHPEV